MVTAVPAPNAGDDRHPPHSRRPLDPRDFAMPPHDLPPAARRAAPAAAGLVAVCFTTGIVAKIFGLEAGILSFLLAATALYLAPNLYLPATPPADDLHSGNSARVEGRQDPDADSDRSTR